MNRKRSNRPWYIYTSGVFNQRQFKGGSRAVCGKRVELKLTLMYLALSPKYKLDDNHKINIDAFEKNFIRNLYAGDCSSI